VRKIALAGVTVLLSASLLSPTRASAVDTVDTQKLREAVTVSGILQHERAFQTIANDNEGIRASGTAGYNASADYVVRALRKAGYKVRKQTFTFPFFRELEPAELSEVSPTARDFETGTFTYSGSGDITGRVIPTNDIVIPPGPNPSTSNSGCEAADFPAPPDDHSIALIQRGTCTFGVKVVNATAAGYAAVIIFNEGQPGRQDLTIGTLGTPQPTPTVGLSFADGEALYTETLGGPVTARVFTSTENDPNRETVNVIADTPEGKIKGQTIVVGAHLDSVTAGPGINDNGSGTSTILEIVEQLAALKYTNKLQRQVRFAFWGAEGLNLLGSQHYVDSLSEAQLLKIYANLNFDMVGSPNYVRFVYDGNGSDTPVAGPPGSAAIEDVFNKYFADQGLASDPTAFDGRSDYGPFIAEGIPAGGLFSGAEGIKADQQAAVYGGTAGVAYDHCYHQACDTIDNVNENALSELGDAAAHATLTLALSQSGLFPDGSRQAQVKVTGTAAKSGPQLTS
jgi:Zn-dependent M28 family amino/carboxypeptidase